MTKNDSSGGRGNQPTLHTPEGLPQRTLPGVPAPSGGMNAGEVTGLLGGDASMTEANLSLEDAGGTGPNTGSDPSAGS